MRANAVGRKEIVAQSLAAVFPTVKPSDAELRSATPSAGIYQPMMPKRASASDESHDRVDRPHRRGRAIAAAERREKRGSQPS